MPGTSISGSARTDMLPGALAAQFHAANDKQLHQSLYNITISYSIMQLLVVRGMMRQVGYVGWRAPAHGAAPAQQLGAPCAHACFNDPGTDTYIIYNIICKINIR